MSQTENNSRNRKIIVIRHGERLDFTFGNSWIQENYVQTDVNMPESLPARDHTHWRHDTALTVLGEHLAQRLGSSLKANGVEVSKVFVSPAFRCLQTANGVVTGMGLENELPLNIEPGLIEWTGFYGGIRPNLLTTEEAAKHFNINDGYEPSMSNLDGAWKESVSDYYERSFKVTKELFNGCDGDILIIAHGASVDSCTRQLLGKEKRSMKYFFDFINKVPYLGTTAIEQNGECFKFIDPPCLTITHDSSKKLFVPVYDKTKHVQDLPTKNFDWKILLHEEESK